MEPHDEFTCLWRRAARRRRIALLLLIAVPTFIATGYMAQVLPHGGRGIMELSVVVVFAILYAWISVGFWTAVVGWLVLVTGRDRFAVSRLAREPLSTEVFDGRCAIVMPIHNEDPARVFAGLEAIHDSLQRTGRAAWFDLFVLSDPGDPDVWVEEEVAWAALQNRFTAGCRLYYRQRQSNRKKKSGNVADFCRRWGNHYRYMVVLDADSMMTGETLVRLVHIMEARPAIGILQTAPRPVNRGTVLARGQQFASRLYGPMFAAGLNFWQLGDSQYWGHNAIIRIAPFMRHCALPRLSGRPPLGGEILSHDFVEAALMRRAGHEVWLAYDLEGSWEELPPTLLDELKRDQRWCQGNLQHMRLLFTRGLYGAHRALFLNGIMAYGSALLWFLFLAASTAMAVLQEIREPDYFPDGRSLFPQWPVWEPQWALVLMISTTLLLFLPKLLSLLLVVKERGAERYGGGIRLLAGFGLELVLAALLAPTRMVFHAKFVLLTLLGRQVSWEAQKREEAGTSWGEAVRFHGGETVFGLVWGAAVFLINRSFFWWLSPIVLSLVLSVPLSVLTSRRRAGRACRNAGLFLIPEETALPTELKAMRETAGHPARQRAGSGTGGGAGFVRAVVDPKSLAVHVAVSPRVKNRSPHRAGRLQGLCDKALTQGPQVLTPREKRELLSDPESLARLHERVWELVDDRLSRLWGLPG